LQVNIYEDGDDAKTEIKTDIF